MHEFPRTRIKSAIGDIMLQILLPNSIISVGNYSNRRMISQSDMEIILSKFTTPSSANEPPELGEIYLFKMEGGIRIFTAIPIPAKNFKHSTPTEPRYEVVYLIPKSIDARQVRIDIDTSDKAGWPIRINEYGTPTLEGWFGRGELYKLNLAGYEQKALNYSRRGFL